MIVTPSIPFSATSPNAASSKRMRVSRLRRVRRGDGDRPATDSRLVTDVATVCRRLARELGRFDTLPPESLFHHILDLNIIVDNDIRNGSNLTHAESPAQMCEPAGLKHHVDTAKRLRGAGRHRASIHRHRVEERVGIRAR
ncbi:hypothetical protein BN2475_120066 [Paraburkholderia ribeironis]|uniref:Uncharacterized protein n=1 Tax=Paraburkholderia ribeironis TaxID=1247936 RepID=A0A1N7RQU0_9BURK|nr:hypothetical protein BN2475_120066 [Paraburkholderia ribeironis]